jgi:hypothetical protein
MLAELRAADLADPAAVSSSMTVANTATALIPVELARAASSTKKAMGILEERIAAAIKRGDLGQLRRWARHGLRASSGQPLSRAAWLGKLDVVKCLVKELGANVNEAIVDGGTPLLIAANNGNVAMVR